MNPWPAVAVAMFIGALWVVWRRRELIYLLLIFLVGMTWRVSSVVYMDVAGPVPSFELFRDIGGGSASLALVSSYIVFFIALFLVFRRLKLAALGAVPVGDELDLEESRAFHARLSGWVAKGYATFLTLLLLELLRGGVIPLFAGIERYVFSNELAGPLHGILAKYGIHISFVLGMFFAYGDLLFGRPDRRFLWLLLATFGYLVLVGNRFSAFYSHGSFFLMPWTAAVIKRQFSPEALARPAATPVAAPVAPPLRRLRRIMAVAGVALIVVTMMGYAMYRSLVFTRNLVGQAALENVAHRVFVLQGEMFTATYERVFERGEADPAFTFDRLFVHPVWDPNRNTTLPHLMELEIGDRVFPILDIGSTYSGGYPEILFELLGPVFGFAGIFVAAIAFAMLFRAVFRAMIELRYVRTLLLFWIAYLVFMFHSGGMLNTFGNWKFAVKLAIVAFWLVWEAGRSRTRPLSHTDTQVA